MQLFNFPVETRKDVFFWESQYMLHTERWSSVLSSSRTPWTCLLLSSRTLLHLITYPCFLPCRASRDSSYVPLLCSCNYTGWLQVDSQWQWDLFSSELPDEVLIMLLLSLVFYRLQIWLNEAMGSFEGGQKILSGNLLFKHFPVPIDLWWLKECTQHSAWNIIALSRGDLYYYDYNWYYYYS